MSATSSWANFVIIRRIEFFDFHNFFYKETKLIVIEKLIE